MKKGEKIFMNKVRLDICLEYEGLQAPVKILK